MKIPDYYVHILHSIRKSILLGEQTDLICCWGRTNFEFCKCLGFSNVVLMDERPFSFYDSDSDRLTEYGELVYWGSCIFRHKWTAILKGFDYFDSVVSVDWDCRQVQKVDDDWWQRQLSFGVPFRATLKRTHKSTLSAFWRSGGERFVLGHCGCALFCDREFVSNCARTNTDNPRFLQKQAMAKYLDGMHGRWIGSQKYAQLGYEADFFLLNTRNQYFRPKMDSVVWEYSRDYQVPKNAKDANTI